MKISVTNRVLTNLGPYTLNPPMGRIITTIQRNIAEA